VEVWNFLKEAQQKSPYEYDAEDGDNANDNPIYSPKYLVHVIWSNDIL
jgi:hypothetical protein